MNLFSKQNLIGLVKEVLGKNEGLKFTFARAGDLSNATGKKAFRFDDTGDERTPKFLEALAWDLRNALPPPPRPVEVRCGHFTTHELEKIHAIQVINTLDGEFFDVLFEEGIPAPADTVGEVLPVKDDPAIREIVSGKPAEDKVRELARAVFPDLDIRVAAVAKDSRILREFQAAGLFKSVMSKNAAALEEALINGLPRRWNTQIGYTKIDATLMEVIKVTDGETILFVTAAKRDKTQAKKEALHNMAQMPGRDVFEQDVKERFGDKARVYDEETYEKLITSGYFKLAGLVKKAPSVFEEDLEAFRASWGLIIHGDYQLVKDARFDESLVVRCEPTSHPKLPERLVIIVPDALVKSTRPARDAVRFTADDSDGVLRSSVERLNAAAKERLGTGAEILRGSDLAHLFEQNKVTTLEEIKTGIALPPALETQVAGFIETWDLKKREDVYPFKLHDGRGGRVKIAYHLTTDGMYISLLITLEEAPPEKPWLTEDERLMEQEGYLDESHVTKRLTQELVDHLNTKLEGTYQCQEWHRVLRAKPTQASANLVHMLVAIREQLGSRCFPVTKGENPYLAQVDELRPHSVDILPAYTHILPNGALVTLVFDYKDDLA